MICPGCNKFPAFEAEVPDGAEIDIDGTQVTGNVRLVLTSQCCSEEMKEYSFEIDQDVSTEVLDAIKAAGGTVPDDNIDEDKLEVEVECTSADPEDRYENKDRYGKPIKSARYMKHMYGVRANFEIKGTYDGTAFSCDVEWFDECASSEMEELV